MTRPTIQTESATPVRLQLSQILRAEIRRGLFAPGARIPSERDLAECYGISRASVREAITELIQAGILFRTVGKGTFVSDAPPVSQPAEPKHQGSCFAISEGVFQFVQMGYNRILTGVEEAYREAGLPLYFRSFKDGTAASEEAQREQLPAGCVVVGGVSRHVLDRFRETATPYVLVDLLMPEDDTDHPAVRIDYAAGTRAALQHLRDLGHRSFGFIGFPGSERYRTYWQTLQEFGVPYDPRHVEFLSGFELQPGMVAGFDAMRRLIAGGNLPTSVIVVNDFVAWGVMEQLKMAGLRVPQDISVVGFDDLAIRTEPALSTVRVDLYLVGRLAARALFEKMAQKRNGEPLESNEIVVPVELVVRRSTAPPRA